MMIWASLAAILAGILVADGYVRNCYYTNWSQYSSSEFKAEHVNPDLCDQISFAYAKLENYALKTIEWNDVTMFKTLNNYKATRPNLKTLIAVGGANADLNQLNSTLSSPTTRALFILSTIDFMETHGFDGISFDWHYPIKNAGSGWDKELFTALCKEIKEVFQAHYRPLLLSLSVPVNEWTISKGYEVKDLVPHVDYFNIISFSYYGSWESKTGHNAPLYCDSRYCVDGSAKYWKDEGVPASKIIVGVSGSGQEWALLGDDTGVGAPGVGLLPAPIFTDVCKYERIHNETFNKKFDDEKAMVPYATHGNIPKYWVSYEDMNSVKYKAALIKENSYAGAMFFSMDHDDFDGTKCGVGSYPLLNTLSAELQA